MTTNKTCPMCQKKLVKHNSSLYWCADNEDEHTYELSRAGTNWNRYWFIGKYSVSAVSGKDYIAILKEHHVSFNFIKTTDSDSINFTSEEDIENFLLLQ